MKTGLFELFKAVNRPEAIAEYLDSSSYDELIEINLNQERFKTLFHVPKKYTAQLPEGNYKDLFVGMSEILVHPDDRERFSQLMDPVTLSYRLQASQVEGLISEEFRFQLINGIWNWVELTLILGERFGLDERVCRMYVFDIQSRKSRELGLNDTYLYSDVNRNEITGLLRKKAFIKSVGELITDGGVDWCLVSVDIENFKLFNEWYGHNEGDLLMAQIGAKLKETAAQSGGSAGYFGQDDFCLLIPYDMVRIRELYESVALMISSHDTEIGFLPAFGVCIVDRNLTVLDMIDRAFLAGDNAKKQYRSRIRVFDPKMYSQEDAEYRILTDFIRSVKKQEITFYLQPQCRVSTGKIVGAEALARWNKPDGSKITPDRFIPVLEKHGLITDLDLYIWEEVCKWQRRWIDSGNIPLPVSVNVSAVDILNSNLTDTFDELTKKYGLDKHLIKIEITESAYIKNTILVKSTVRSLRENGFTVLMDDFGSGYSTLNMLREMSVDVIKLDAQFLHMDESNTEKGIRIIESVTNMAKTIGLPIIVEGVETEKQVRFLQDMGCRYIQGYYFYRPMTQKEYEELIADRNRIDTSGICFKSNQQFRLREILDNNVYSDTMLNNILGPCAIYALHGRSVDIIRYNEQFYEAVDVPDFADRLTDIQRFMPEREHDKICELLEKSKEDRLNGAKGIFHFYKTDGSLTTFYMRFYYLRQEDDRSIFYGSVQNITKLSTLEKQMTLLSQFSQDTVIFLSRKPDDSLSFAVLFHGLENVVGMTKQELEDALNRKDFFDRISADNSGSLLERLYARIKHSESFVAELYVTGNTHTPVRLTAYGDYIIDDTGIMDYIVTVRRPSSDTLR